MKILLVDDHKLMRDGLRAILERKGHHILGEASDGYEALEIAHSTKPNMVLMDVTLPKLNGIDATRRLKSELPETRVLALSMNSDRRYVIAMFRAGAVGYLLKNAASDELIQAIEAVSRNLRYVSPMIAGPILDSLVMSGMAAAGRPLSVRERQVLQLIAEGMGSKQIAERLDLALPTIDTHRRQIMDKLGLRSIAELTKYAVREGLTSLD